MAPLANRPLPASGERWSKRRTAISKQRAICDSPGAGGGGAVAGRREGTRGRGVAASLSLWTSPLTRFASLRKGSARKSTSPRTRGEVEQVARVANFKQRALCDSPAVVGERDKRPTRRRQTLNWLPAGTQR